MYIGNNFEEYREAVLNALNIQGVDGVRNFENYRRAVLTKLGVTFTEEDLRNEEHWRLKVLEGINSGGGGGLSIKTASGAIVSLNDAVANKPILSLKADITPKQSGSGDPSPSNVRPISGYNTVNIYVSPTSTAGDGNTYPISLGQTVYGGTLEVMSGKLTITKGFVDLGSLNWTYNAQYHAFYTYDLTSVIKKGPGIKADILCSIYPVDNDADPFDRNKVISSTTVWAQGNIIVVDDSYTSATAFKTAMNGVQLVYELATPTEITLTPTQVTTLLGNNNIFADSGSVEVEYIATGGAQ